MLERRTEHSVVLLAAEPAIVLRGTGVAVWDAFAGPRMVADVVAELALRYNAPVELIERDALPVLTELRTRGALIGAGEQL